MEENVKARCILELMARPKEVAVNALKSIIGKIEENGKKLIVSDEKYSEPKEVENGFFSVYAEFNIEGDFDSIFNFVLDYAPSSIEILEPNKLTLDMATLQTALNDLSGRLNELDQKIKIYSANNVLLSQENEKLKQQLQKN